MSVSLLRRCGLESEIFTDDLDPRLAGQARPLADLPPPDRGRSALVYQCSIGNGVVDRLLDRDEPLVVNYHNLTPAEQLLRWAPEMAHLVSWGRHQLRRLAQHAVLGVGDSTYNSADLLEVGFRTVATAPVLIDLPVRVGVVDRPLDGARWLFVGRIVPNKAQHDVIAALAWYRAVHDAVSGAPPGRECRRRAVPRRARRPRRRPRAGRRRHVHRCRGRCGAAPRVREGQHGSCASRTTKASASRSSRRWRSACPSVAFGAAAVPETVGDAGLVLPGKSPALVAAAVHRLATDPALRSSSSPPARSAQPSSARQPPVRASSPRYAKRSRCRTPQPRPPIRAGATGSIDRP